MGILIKTDLASPDGRTIAGFLPITVAGIMAARHPRRARPLGAGAGDPIGRGRGALAVPGRPHNPAGAPLDRWNPAGNSLDYPSAIFETTDPAVMSGGAREIVQAGGARPLAASCHLDYTPGSIWEQLP